MTSQLFAICFNSPRPSGLARFWSGVLGWELAAGPDDGVAVLHPDPAGFRIRFLPGQEPKTGQNRAHFDLTSASPEDQRQTVDRALGLGGKHIDVGQLPEDGHVVLADPDGNEFCVIEAGEQVPRSTPVPSARWPATERRRSATSGARPCGGRWSGTRTRRPRSSRRTAARSSPGVARRWRRRRGRTGCTSSWRFPPTPTGMRRSAAWSHSARRSPKPARAKTKTAGC